MSSAQSKGLACDFELTVSGGEFSPDICHFEIITGGTCRESAGCRLDYALVLRNSGPITGEINSVVFFNFRELKSGTYSFDPGKSFKGELIDQAAIAHPLLGGEVTLQLWSDDKVLASCDVIFANGIRLQGSGLLVVKRLYAP
jgi:hypothetical protein